MNKIDALFQEKKDILSIYTTAGYPQLEDTVAIVKELSENGVDLIEVGMPYSDPLADGETIQKTSSVALKNGISLEKIFEQVREARKSVEIPLILMGYYNQIIQYGSDSFFSKAKEVGVDGFIIPDMPLEEYSLMYEEKLKELDLKMIFLITPQTSDERIKHIDSKTSGFIYVVSSFGVTGNKSEFESKQLDYFNRLKGLNLKHPKLIGFGIHNKETYNKACQNADGAIIGSAFLKAISDKPNTIEATKNFVQSLR